VTFSNAKRVSIFARFKIFASAVSVKDLNVLKMVVIP
jgi:hypothetical protein